MLILCARAAVAAGMAHDDAPKKQQWVRLWQDHDFNYELTGNIE